MLLEINILFNDKITIMKARTKLISTIVAMCLVITLGVFGILAVKTLNMSVGGNITFSADGLALEVSQGQFKTTENASYSNITTQNGKLQAFAIDTDTKLSSIQDKIDSWSGLELQLDSKGDAILHFSVTNKMTTPLYVYIATELGTNINDNMSIIVSPSGAEITANSTTNFTITFDILDTSINAGLSGFEIDVDFDRGEKFLQTQNKIDQATGLPTTEVDYYYVEMGTYKGQPVRWRYVADSNFVRYDGTSLITSLRGYYVLETEISETISFVSADKLDSNFKHKAEGYTSINANDYGMSDLRAFLRNTGAGGFMELLGISTNNPIYSIISGRTVKDLYKRIRGSDGTEIPSSDPSFSMSLTGDKDISQQVDKFWILSVMIYFVGLIIQMKQSGPALWRNRF